MYAFLRFPNFRKKALTLSYDDGVVYDRKLIEIMGKYGLKGTFNLNSSFFARDEKYFTKEEAVQLYKESGNEIAVHGYRHLNLVEVDKTVATREVLTDRENLESIFGACVRGMAYAYGAYNDTVVEILKNCGIAYSRTVISTEKFDIPNDWLRLPATCHHNNPRLMELAEEFLGDTPARHFWQEKPKLFYLWGHSYEFNNDDNWDIIERFAEKVGNRKDVWYATNMEIYDYVQAFNRLIFSVDGKRVKNPSAVDLWLCLYGQEVFLPAGAEKTVEKNY